MKDVMPLEDCLEAAIECNAPMVSVCGGEPLIYPQIEALVTGLLEQRRIVYVCTNGMWMRRKMRDYLAVSYARQPDSVLPLNWIVSTAEKLLTPSEIEQIKKGPKDPAKPVIAPNGWMYWNVHLDGLEKDPRHHRRTGGSLPGVYPCNAHGENSRLPGCDKHHRLP